jgi:hypothetical protein
MEEIEHFSFLKDSFALAEQDLGELRRQFLSAPRANVAYSAWAIKLTLMRKRVLDFFGLKVQTVYDREPLEVYASFDPPNEAVRQGKRFATLRPTEKLLEIPRRGINRLRGSLKWRRLMQGAVNNLLPYRKYPLPETCLDSPAIRESYEFLRVLKYRGEQGSRV